MGVFAPQTVSASGLHADVSMETYVDFGQNRGRYAVGNTNALLDYLNKDGVIISYTGGQADYTLQHGMIDFSSQRDSGEGAAIGYNFYATVRHNGVHNNTFAGNYVGSGNAIHYQSIEYRESENNNFLLTPSVDYKLSRQNKLITDVTGSTVYSGELSDLKGDLMYRAASGMMYQYDHQGNQTGAGWQYIVGGIMAIDGVDVKNANQGAFSVYFYTNPSSAGVNGDDPLPFVSMKGDSGSPSWVWNSQTGQYEYLSGDQSGDNALFTQYQGATTWTNETMASFDKLVNIGADNTVYVNGTQQTDTVISDSVNEVSISTTIWQGTVTDAEGNVLTNYIGVKDGVNTWNDLSVIKDRNNWYSYDSVITIDGVSHRLFNATSNGSGAQLNYADLFKTENLVFTASSTATQNVILTDTVDLGIGYAQFSKGEQNTATFNVTAENGAQLNSAGYVVDAGVDVHLKITNSTADIMREWRKIGEGNLHLEGAGNNNILLNVGGDGVTYLNQDGGYAAYNVLANNGTTVVIKDINQIARDFTFGFRGGVLDMNGNSMTWNNANTDVSADGFTIQAQDEGAIITNTAAQTVTLTWTQGGNQTWLGSFRDTEQGGLKFVYDGGGKLTMNGIYTNLQHNDAGGIEVKSGQVTLVGVNTQHGAGFTNDWWSTYFSNQDWHYADMAADVTVASNATFELGSHARLNGDVNVAAGGAFIMREGVKHEMEYIEGGHVLESTYAIADFYGLKGNVTLAENANMNVVYSDGTTANTTYAGNITGAGNFSATLGTDGATLTLTGTNTFSGTKQVVSGGLIADGLEALGDVSGGNTWNIGEKAWLAVQNVTDAQNVLGYVDGSSEGVLALTADQTTALDMSNHTNLSIGATEGQVVHYGTADAVLSANGGYWLLGGGGGELVVDFQLSGTNGLILGNEYGHGTVTLNNAANNFTGEIKFVGGVTLHYTSLDALGEGKNVNLAYTGRIRAMAGISDRVMSDSRGVLLINNATDIELDLRDHEHLYVGADGDAVFTGTILVDDAHEYRFGGITGTLTLDTVLGSGHNLIVDGQTYSGGKLVLAGAQNNLNGTLTLTGHNPDRTHYDFGDITLSFAAGVDNALLGVTGVAMNDGGMLDLAGTQQTLANVVTQSGSVIFDSVGGGTLNLTGTNVLGGVNNVGNTVLMSGTAKLTAGQALSSGKVFTLTDGTTLDMNGQTVTGTVAVSGGNAVLTNGVSQVASLNGGMNLASGSAVTLTGGNFASSAQHLGGEGATTYIHVAGLSLNSNQSQYIAGTTNIDRGGSTEISSDGSADNMIRTFDRLVVESGNTLNLKDHTWNSIWNIHRLSGSGNLNWNVTGTHWYSTRLLLDGESDFNGALTVNRNQQGYDANANRAYSAYLELAHEKAAHQATITLTGANASSVAGLAVNTDNTYVTGLTGNQFTYLYAGASYTGGGRDNANMGAAPASTRQAGLTITGAGEQTFAGQVGTVNDGSNGFRLVMAGTGNQIFSGSSLNVTGVEVQSGTLTLNAAGLNVRDDISIARGGALTLTDNGVAGTIGTWSLDAGNTLHVVSATGSEAAIFNGNLTLNGGVLSFDGSAISKEDAELTLNGALTLGGDFTQQVVNLNETSSLTAGVYLLADGNWSALSGSSITVDGMDYLTATFNTDATGLTMTLSAKEGSVIWDGNDESCNWSAGNFGQQTGTPNSGDVAVFTDSAANKNVNIVADSTVKEMLFDTHSDAYNLSADGGAVTTESLTKRGDGTVTLESGVTVNGTTTIENGELVVNGAGVLKGTVTGEGTLTLKSAAAQDAPEVSNLANLNIVGGQLNATHAVGANNITVTSGGTLRLAEKVAQGGNLTMSDADSVATLTMGAASAFNGSLNLAGDTTVQADGVATISGAIAMNGHELTKSGAGNLSLTANNGNFENRTVNVTAGELSLNGNNNNLDGSTIKLAQGTTLNLSGLYSSYKQFTISGPGTAKLVGSNAEAAILSGAGTVVLTDGATISLNGHGSKGNILLQGGTFDAFNNGIDGSITADGANNRITATGGGANVWLSGHIAALAGADLILDCGNNNKTINISGGLELGAGSAVTINGANAAVMNVNSDITTNGNAAQLTLKGTFASDKDSLLAKADKVTLKDSTFNSAVTNFSQAGNTVYIQDSTWVMTKNGGNNLVQNVRGTLAVQGDATEIRSTHKAGAQNNNLTRNFDHIDIAAGSTLNLTEGNWNTVWNVNRLTGEGKLSWNSTSDHWYSSRLVVSGEGDFSGVLELNRDYADAQNTPSSYFAYIELADGKAAQNATLSLNGAAAKEMASLAVNATDAYVGGLNGNANSYMYAGTALAGEAGNSAALNMAPTSTLQSVLTITGGGDYVFNGNIDRTADGNGFALVMDGAGTQSITKNVALNGVSANAGTLALNGATNTIYGSISAADGVLTMDNGSISFTRHQAGVQTKAKIATPTASIDHATVSYASKLTTITATDATATMNGMLITQSADNTLKLDNVLMDAASQVSGGKVDFTTLEVQLQSGVNTQMAAGDALAMGTGLTLMESGEIVVLERDIKVQDLLCSSFADTQVSGDTLVLDFSGMDESVLNALTNGQYLFCLNFGDMSSTLAALDGSNTASLDLNGMNVVAKNASENVAVYTGNKDGSTALFIGNVNSVPEPSTATLALAAMAVGAMRRRRK